MLPEAGFGLYFREALGCGESSWTQMFPIHMAISPPIGSEQSEFVSQDFSLGFRHLAYIHCLIYIIDLGFNSFLLSSFSSFQVDLLLSTHFLCYFCCVLVHFYKFSGIFDYDFNIWLSTTLIITMCYISLLHPLNLTSTSQSTRALHLPVPDL